MSTKKRDPDSTLADAVTQAVAGMEEGGRVIAESAGLTAKFEPPKLPKGTLDLVFVHPGPVAQEVPGLGVFEPGQTVVFADETAAEAAFNTGWFAPPGGKSLRQLMYEHVAAGTPVGKGEVNT
jgi:hypothetical protein